MDTCRQNDMLLPLPHQISEKVIIFVDCTCKAC